MLRPPDSEPETRDQPIQTARSLDRLSLGELRELRAQVDAAIRTGEREVRRAAFQDLEACASELGLSRADLKAHYGGTRRSGRAGAEAVRYRHPETGQTWAGTGRRPNWIKQHIAAGGTLESVAVGQDDQKA